MRAADLLYQWQEAACAIQRWWGCQRAKTEPYVSAAAERRAAVPADRAHMGSDRAQTTAEPGPYGTRSPFTSDLRRFSSVHKGGASTPAGTSIAPMAQSYTNLTPTMSNNGHLYSASSGVRRISKRRSQQNATVHRLVSINDREFIGRSRRMAPFWNSIWPQLNEKEGLWLLVSCLMAGDVARKPGLAMLRWSVPPGRPSRRIIDVLFATLQPASRGSPAPHAAGTPTMPIQRVQSRDFGQT